MTKEDKTYTFGTDQGNIDLFASLIAEDVSSEMPELKPYLNYRKAFNYGGKDIGKRWSVKPEDSKKVCNLIQKRSLAAAIKPISNQNCAECSTPFITETSMTSNKVQYNLESCIHCHTGKDPIGPEIPFNSPEKLSPSELKKINERLFTDDERLKMPLGRTIDKKEAKSLLNYLKSFQRKK